MIRSSRFLRAVTLGALVVVLVAGAAPSALGEEGAEESTPELISEEIGEQGDANDFTGTYELAGSTGKGNKFAAVIHIWDQGTQATVRGVVPQLGRAMSWSFPVKQLSDNEYQISGSVGIPFVLNASGSATISKTSSGYDIGGAGSGSFMGKDGSATFGGSRTSGATDGLLQTAIIDKEGNETTTDAEGNKTVIKAPPAVVEPLAPAPESEMPPVSEDTKGLLIALIAMMIAVQLVTEVVMGGSVSLGDIKDTFEAGSEAVEEISQSVSEGGDEG